MILFALSVLQYDSWFFFSKQVLCSWGLFVDDDRNIINPDVKIQPFRVVVLDCNSRDNFSVWYYATLSAVLNYFFTYGNFISLKSGLGR
ncbi:hypothetical protein [Butyricimonas virosa]